MRFRTKLFIVWSSLVLLLCAGIWQPIHRTIQNSFSRVAEEGFSGAERSLHALQAEQVNRMRQAGGMVMNIPDLRALIAENNFELSIDNRASLQERLDGLSKLVDVQFICVLDAHGQVIAQNHGSPWPSTKALEDYRIQSANAQGLIRHLFGVVTGSKAVAGESFALWNYSDHLYQVVGVPLIFSSTDDPAARADGAMIMANPLTDELTATLAKSHSCEVTFFEGNTIVASSLPDSTRQNLLQFHQQTPGKFTSRFDLELAGIPYRSSMEPIRDPDSGNTVGAMLIQRSLADSQAIQTRISQSLLVIMSCGVLVAAFASFIFSAAVTRPVQSMLGGVKRVGQGDLDLVIPVGHRDELGELATAFNAMVAQLRSRRDLERQVEESRAVSRAKSQFLANMSHEIRTPLNGVIGMAALLLRTNLDDRQRRFASMVKSSAEVLTTLINDILDLSKIEAGKLELESVAFDLHSVIGDAVELLSIKCFEKRLEMVCDIAADVPVMVIGDPTRLRQVLINLLNNAIKFTEHGEVTLRATRNTNTSDDLIQFAVIDSGIGIPADKIGRLFKNFSQVDSSTTRRFGGTGLGLAISRQLTELMGGGITVESEEGRGSTFRFSVRLAAAQETTGARGAIPELENVRALVVDDNPTACNVIREQLTHLGLQVTGASTLAETLSVLRQSSRTLPFRLLLIDGQMAGLASSQLVRAIREGLEFPALRVVILQPLGADPLPSSSTDFDGTVTKPIRPAQLRGSVLKALQSSQSPEAAHRPATQKITRQQRPESNGLRILVAEDNEVNQLVAADVLEEAGYAYEVVSTGKKALEAVCRQKFDLILMDCQMPEMDGLTAARAIRQIERSSEAGTEAPRRVPIIALTANASGRDRNECLAAGMDDYCSKPFAIDQLLQKIKSFLPGTAAASPEDAKLPETSPDAADTTQPHSSESIQQLPPFDVAALLERCAGKSTLAGMVLEKFEKQVGDAVTLLQRSVAEADAEQVARTSHLLKGTAGMIAAEPMRMAASLLEQSGRQQEVGLFADHLARLQEEIRQCVEYVNEARTKLGVGAVIPI